MDKLTTLAISYPDFQLNQIIDPEQMDLNNLQIVNKINNIIKSFNELIQGTSGAGNITIAPIPEFSDATTVQQALQQIATFVKTLDADAKRQFAELVQKNSQQDTEIQSIKSVNTRQDSRLQSLESTQTNHTQRIGAIEQKNTSQDNEINAIKQKNNEQDGRLTTAEGTINTHTSQISKVQEKDVEQDRRISGIESREELDTAFVNKIEKRVGVNETDIQKLQEDFAQLEGKDPVAELVVARTSGHTQETFRTLGDRLDHNEIPVKTDFTGQLRGAVNFRVVDENTTETWENHVKLGDIAVHDESPIAHETQFATHNESPIAHEVMMAEHEMDETSHSDIREKIATHETSGTSHSDIREKIATHETSGTSHSDIREKIATHETSGNSHNDIREKIIGLGEKDLELDKKINVLSEYKNMGSVSASNPNSNYKTGLFNVGTPIDGKYFYVTKIKYPDLGDGYYKLIAYGFDASDDKVKDSIWTGRIHAGQFTGWVEYATTEQINVLSNRICTDSNLIAIETTEVNLDKYNNISVDMPNNTHYRRRMSNSVNVPQVGGGTWYMEGYKATNDYEWQMIRSYHNGFMKFREKTLGGWTNWREIATTDKTDILLPLNSGYDILFGTDDNSVVKNSLGMVTLSFTVKKNDDTTIGGSFMSLPVGFRPRKNVTAVGRVYDSTNGVKTTTFVVFSNGNVELRGEKTVKAVSGTITYYA